MNTQGWLNDLRDLRQKGSAGLSRYNEMTEAFMAGVVIFAIPGLMAVVYRCVGILTVDVVFFRSLSVFHSQDSFPSTFRPRLWETSSGVVAVGVFAAVARRELWARPPKLHLIYVVHAYCCYVIGQHSDNWNLSDQLRTAETQKHVEGSIVFLAAVATYTSGPQKDL